MREATRTRKYLKPISMTQRRRAMRILIEWRVAILRAEQDENLAPPDYVEKHQRLARKYDLWNEFEYLAVNKDIYISDLLKHVCAEAIRYIFKGDHIG